MKHNTKITAILITMFLVTQLIGLFVVASYINGIDLPYGMEPPADVNQDTSVVSIVIAFIIAISLFILLTKIKAEAFIRLWFFVVTIIALGLSLNVILLKLTLTFYVSIMAIVIAFPLAYYKIYKRQLFIHNQTELLIYPGIAAVFIPLLNVMGITVLLLVISFYDIWAVWQSEFMQKMAKYQIENLKFFTGFFVPYADKKQKQKIKELKEKYGGNEKVLESEFKKARIKVNLAILGGGDIIFPIITAGIFYRTAGLLPALIITVSATLALLFLFVLARKGKFYPAMPFLTMGMYLGMIVSWLI